MKSGNIPIPWNSVIQRDIDALSDFSFFENEAHVLAVKNHFKEKVDYTGAIEVVRMCCTQQGEQRNRHTFTMCVYNRMKLLPETLGK